MPRLIPNRFKKRHVFMFGDWRFHSILFISFHCRAWSCYVILKWIPMKAACFSLHVNILNPQFTIHNTQILPLSTQPQGAATNIIIIFMIYNFSVEARDAFQIILTERHSQIIILRQLSWLNNETIEAFQTAIVWKCGNSVLLLWQIEQNTFNLCEVKDEAILVYCTLVFFVSRVEWQLNDSIIDSHLFLWKLKIAPKMHLRRV